MRKDQLYSIGQASKICNLSIQTLRFYDKIGLVNPSETDKFTGYRYYSNHDLLHVKIVQGLKSLNFKLEEISHTLKSNKLNSMMEMMEAKHAEALQEIRRLEQITTAIEQRMAQVNYLQALSDEFKELDVLIELKNYPDRCVAFDRRRDAVGMERSVTRFTELFHKIEMNGLTPHGYTMSVYHENIMTFEQHDCDIEVCIPVESGGAESASTRIIEGGEFITALYCGIPNRESCKRIYGKLLEWMSTNGYDEIGPSMEQYLVDMTQMGKPEDFIVELQVPVTKRLTL
ncbi:MerR family transcriptional regulator [Paenibacillus sp. NEAU-GSW1]|uniref:MerR family transcriptional regulator n=1 Tax=Paenibacillus sp. NEAU-GSW1 TaxID=2682486 RepID=UPI0012E14E00|nr:MerR family transcriptional regulator [Paenibacillus sp. NEAU-GSW1]MUT67440.1 MerR family transcriptional regulator [Paenibacillus sp. NEAU-GSW1]